MFAPAVRAFLETFTTWTDDQLIAVSDRVAKLMAGASVELFLGLAVGLMQGLLDGILDPIMLIVMAVQAVVWLTDTLGGAVQSVVDPEAAAARTEREGRIAAATAQTGDTVTATNTAYAEPAVTLDAARMAAYSGEAPAEASATTTTGNAETDAGGGLDEAAAKSAMLGMAGELAGPVTAVGENFQPAVEAFFSAETVTSVEDVASKMGTMWDAASGAMESFGAWLGGAIG
jgi:hypothetical protein